MDGFWYNTSVDRLNNRIFGGVHSSRTPLTSPLPLLNGSLDRVERGMDFIELRLCRATLWKRALLEQDVHEERLGSRARGDLNFVARDLTPESRWCPYCTVPPLIGAI